MDEIKKIVEMTVKHFEKKKEFFRLFWEASSSAEGWVTWEIIKVLKEEYGKRIKELKSNKKVEGYKGRPDIFFKIDSKKIILEIKARYFEPEKYKNWLFDTKRALDNDLQKYVLPRMPIYLHYSGARPSTKKFCRAN